MAGVALPGIRNELTTELCGAQTKALPCLQDGQNDASEGVFTHQQPAYMLVKFAAFARWHEQPERLHQPTDLVRELGRHPDEPSARRDQRARQHALIFLHPYLAEKADLG